MSDQPVLTSSLSTEREYVCPGEVVTYVCNGTGNEIEMYAPPHVSSAERFSYLRGDNLGPGQEVNSVRPHLISTDEPHMVASVTLEGSLCLSKCSIKCEVRSPAQSTQSAEMELKTSGMMITIELL